MGTRNNQPKTWFTDSKGHEISLLGILEGDLDSLFHVFSCFLSHPRNSFLPLGSASKQLWWSSMVESWKSTRICTSQKKCKPFYQHVAYSGNIQCMHIANTVAELQSGNGSQCYIQQNLGICANIVVPQALANKCSTSALGTLAFGLAIPSKSNNLGRLWPHLQIKTFVKGIVGRFPMFLLGGVPVEGESPQVSSSVSILVTRRWSQCDSPAYTPHHNKFQGSDIYFRQVITPTTMPLQVLFIPQSW